MRNELIDSIRLIPYSLRIVALILIFNGMFALIESATILMGNDGSLDWRIANMAIGYGLLIKRRVWYIAACISVGASAVLHVKSILIALTDYQTFGVGGILYFILALALDLGMSYVLLRHLTSKNFFTAKGNS